MLQLALVVLAMGWIVGALYYSVIGNTLESIHSLVWAIAMLVVSDLGPIKRRDT